VTVSGLRSPTELVAPAYEAAPAYTETLGGEVAELAVLAGFAPDPEQRLALDLIFALSSGRSAAFEVAVVAARQNLKTGVFLQAALGWLFVTESPLVVWSAHEFRTSREAFRALDELIAGTPALSRRVLKVATANGDESIELRNRCRVIFKARTSTGGRGLSGDKVVLDEAFALLPEHMGALLPTVSARPDPQVVYGSSAGMRTSAVLRGIRDRGRAGAAGRLGYLEWASDAACADLMCAHQLGADGCALDVEDNWRPANPMLGRRRPNGTGLSVEHVRAERAAMPPAEFARERMGWWDDAPEPGAAWVIDPAVWAGLADPAAPRPALPGLGLAVSADRAWASLGATGALPDGSTLVELIENRRGTGWIVARAAELAARHGTPLVVNPGEPAAGLIPALRTAGVDLLLPTAREVAQACAALYDAAHTAVINPGEPAAGLIPALRTAQLRHLGQPALNTALGGARKRKVGDGLWAWDLERSPVDVAPLSAVTLAWHGMTTAPPPAAPPPLPLPVAPTAGSLAGVPF
jgi:hypothetical protein